MADLRSLALGLGRAPGTSDEAELFALAADDLSVNAKACSRNELSRADEVSHAAASDLEHAL
jgi:hypothetical protein